MSEQRHPPAGDPGRQSPGEDPRPPLTSEELDRWELFGAGWRLVELHGDHAVVEMRACTGETVELRRAEEPALLERLQGGQP